MQTSTEQKISALFAPRAFALHAKVKTQQEALDALAQLANAAGYLNDEAAFRAALQAREDEVSTGIGGGLALPHARGGFVRQAGLCVLRAPDGCAFHALDGEPVYLFFLILCPENAADLHMQVLSRLSELLLERPLCDKLLHAETPVAFCALLDEAQANLQREKMPAPDPHPQLLAVTACPMGIAHTHMAAESLRSAAAYLGVSLKVEADGAGGVENALTEEEIQHCTAIIVAADRHVDLERFEGKPLLRVPVTEGILHPQELLERASGGDLPLYHTPLNARRLPNSTEPTGVPQGRKRVAKRLFDVLMAGVSAMIPFVTVGGFLIALSYILDTFFQSNSPFADWGRNFPITSFLNFIGNTAFDLMFPVFAGFIARALAGMPGFVTGFLGGWLAEEGACLYNGTFVTEDTPGAPVTSAGFLGAAVAGVLAGAVVWLLLRATQRMPRSLDALRAGLIVPAVGIAAVGCVMLFLLDPLLSEVNEVLADVLSRMHSGEILIPTILLCTIAAALMAADFGGPLNKAVYLVGTASLTVGGQAQATEFMASILLGGMVPSLAVALCATFFPNRFTHRQRTACASNYVLGLCFVTEGALPIAMSDPLRVVPACMGGSAVAGCLSAAFHCTLGVPTGGIFIFPLVSQPLFYLLALAAGSFTGMALLAILRRPLPPNETGLPVHFAGKEKAKIGKS